MYVCWTKKYVQLVVGSWLSGGLIMDCPLEEWKGVVDWVLDSEPYVTACLHEKPEWELMRTMGWARRYEGAELGEVPGWYDHRDPYTIMHRFKE